VRAREVGRIAGCRACRGASLLSLRPGAHEAALHQALDGSNGERTPCPLLLCLHAGQGGQLLPFPADPGNGHGGGCRRHTARQEGLAGIRHQVAQFQGGEDAGAADAEALCHLVARQLADPHQPLVPVAQLQWVHVGAGQILGQLRLEHLHVRHVAHDDRHLLQARLLGRPQAPVPEDELQFAVDLPSHQGLKHALGADAVGQLGEVAEHLARVGW
jgi:hypothetical protein